MKRLLVVMSLFLSTSAFAVSNGPWISSNTATADTAQSLCGNKRGYLHAVRVNDSPPGSGTIAIYNARVSATNPFAVIRATAAFISGGIDYDVQMSSGIVYTNSTTNNISILYQCY